MTTATAKVQTIDFRSATAGRDFVQSLHETGFAVLSHHPIPHTLLDRIYQDWAAFFASDDTHQFHYDTDSDHSARAGFYPIKVSETAVGHPVKDLKEFFHVIPGHPVPKHCEAAIMEYRTLGFALGASLVEWIQSDTPAAITAKLPEPLTDVVCEEASLLRVLHYPPLSGTETAGALRAAAHEDINLITILPVAEQAGLQVRDKRGNWIDVSGNRGDLIINSGDMLREATDGYYPSASHRVLNPGNGIGNVARISVPLFLTPRLTYRLSDRYTSGSYLDERLKLIRRHD